MLDHFDLLRVQEVAWVSERNSQGSILRPLTQSGSIAVLPPPVYHALLPNTQRVAFTFSEIKGVSTSPRFEHLIDEP